MCNKHKIPVISHWDFVLALFELVEEINHIIVIKIDALVFSVLKPKILFVYARLNGASVVNVSHTFRRRNDNVFAAIRNRVLEVEVFDGPNRLNQMYDAEHNDRDAIPKGKLGRHAQEESEDGEEYESGQSEWKCGLLQVVPAESHEKFLL